MKKYYFKNNTKIESLKDIDKEIIIVDIVLMMEQKKF